MSGAANIARLVAILIGVVAPALAVHWATSEPQGTYRAVRTVGQRGADKPSYDKLHSQAWLSAAASAELARVQAQIAKAEADIAHEELRLSPR